MEIIKQSSYNLAYCDCNFLIKDIFTQLQEFNISRLSKTDFQKLILHFLILNFLKINKTKTYTEKTVFFFCEDNLTGLDSGYINSFKACILKVKKILPLSVCLISDLSIFTKNNGDLQELNQLNSNFYSNKNISSKKLIKYLKKESFFDLCSMLRCINNIKTITN